MRQQKVVFEILKQGLLDIRIACHEGDVKRAFDLADLLHNTPGRLSAELEKGGDSSALMDWLVTRSAEKGLSRWLQEVLRQFSS